LLFARDRIQDILENIKPDESVPQPLYEKIYVLDELMWQERRSFLIVIGEKELKRAREQQKSPRSHLWWYIDELKAPFEQDSIWKYKAFPAEIIEKFYPRPQSAN